MSRTPLNILACLAAVGSAAHVAHGGAVQFQLGEQDFADGKTPVFSREVRDAGRGEAFPFDGTIFGNDVKAAAGLGAFDFSHRFDVSGAKPVSATLTIGLIDIDSPPDAPLDTILLTFDGVEQPAGLLAGASAVGARSSVEVFDVPVPVELLADGALHVAVAARRPGAGNLGNAIEPDFSRLVVETAHAGPVDPPVVIPDPTPGPVPGPDPGPQPVPVPPVLIPAGALLAALAALPKRRVRRWLGA